MKKTIIFLAAAMVGWSLPSATAQSAEEQMHEYVEGKKAVNNKDYAKAFEWFTKAADKGNTAAMIYWGDIYRYGWFGVAEDRAKGREWYLKAADKGNVKALSYIAHSYLGEKNYVKAREWFIKAADRGYVKSMKELGNMYKEGRDGIEKDIYKAREWYLKAADKGDVDAMLSVGKTYYDEKDYVKAREWYSKAADRGYDQAMHEMGKLYYYGFGVNKDYVKAREWFVKAGKFSEAWVGTVDREIAKANTGQSQSSDKASSLVGTKWRNSRDRSEIIEFCRNKIAVLSYAFIDDEYYYTFDGKNGTLRDWYGTTTKFSINGSKLTMENKVYEKVSSF